MLEIIRNNNFTFYNYRTRKKQNPVARIAVFCAASISMSLLFSKEIGGFLESIITVLSILVGFSFSVLFFLMSGNKAECPRNSPIEIKLKSEKISTLHQEIFYNVSYFNIASIVCIIISVILLLPSPSLDWMPTIIKVAFSERVFKVFTEEYAHLLRNLFNRLALIVFYFLLIESVYTFFRAVGRVSYYFESKLELDKRIADLNKENVVGPSVQG